MAQLVEVGPGPVNESERKIVKLLVDGLPDSYRVIPNVTLKDRRRGQHYEYDVIVLTGHAVYVVEVKGWRGRVRALSRSEWQLPGGRYVSNPLPLNDNKARVLASQLKELTLSHGGKRLRTPFVASCLAGGTDTVDFDVLRDDIDRCLKPRELCAFIDDPSHLPSVTKKNTYHASLDKLTRHISGTLEARDSTPRRFESYLVTSLVAQDDESTTYLAKHAEFDDGRVYRIRAHAVSHYLYGTEERTKRLEALKRSAEALHRIGDHPNVVSLRAFGETEDGFFEVTDWSDAGSLATSASLGTMTKVALRKRLRILLGIARALVAAQAQGIHHRNLRPEAILLGADAEPRVGDFDLAFIEDAKHTVYGADAVKKLRTHPYLAPELRDPLNYDVFESTDLFALGRIAYDLFTGKQPEGDDLPLLADAVPLPEAIAGSLSDLVAALTQTDPGDRPDSPADVVDSIEGIERQLQDSPAAESAPKAIPRASAAVLPEGHRFVPGEHIDDSHEVIEFLGEGSTALAYRVKNELLGDDELVLKLALPDADPDGPLREFKLLRRIQHAQVVRAHWTGKLSGASVQPTYVLLERLHGARLDQRMSKGALLAAEALPILSSLAEAIGAVHESGVIHRDVKAANVYITDRGSVLADFGSAVQIAAADADPAGTPRYCPPDLSDGGWDPSADVFAFGCIAYELLVGQHPWGEHAPAGDIAPSPWPAVEGVGAHTLDVLRNALASDRHVRPSDGRALHTALTRAVELDARRPSPTPSDPSPSPPPVSSVAKATWSATWVTELAAADDALAFLYRTLRTEAYASVVESEEDIVAAEQQAFLLEAPLPDVVGSIYDRLAEPLGPLDVKASGEPPSLTFDRGHRLIVLDGLWLGELPRIVQHFNEWQLDEWLWSAGLTDPKVADESRAALDRLWKEPPKLTDMDPHAIALGDETAAARVELPLGNAGEPLSDVVARRAQIIDAAVARCAEHPAVTWITTSHGVAYLGHGLRLDVGIAVPKRADGIRSKWRRVCGDDRLGRGSSNKLEGPVYRPSRSVGGRLAPVGRLAWPEADDAPVFARGGLSLPERMLPILRFTPPSPST